MEVSFEPTPSCSVEVMTIRFAEDASTGEVNRVHRAASAVAGIRTVKRAEELSDPPLVEVTTVDGVGASGVAEIAAASTWVTSVETACAKG